MKIALDEHVAPALVDALKALQGERGMLGVEIVSARDYPVPKAMSDVPWLERFASDGGNVVVSGDAKMRGKLHEQRALIKAGFLVFFMARRWNNMKSHDKAAMLIKCWPEIMKQIKTATPPRLFEIPCSWTDHDVRDVTPPELRVRRRRRKAEKVVAAPAASSEPQSATPEAPPQQPAEQVAAEAPTTT